MTLFPSYPMYEWASDGMNITISSVYGYIMKLISITYRQHENTASFWSLQNFTLDPFCNLIVGKNATGKTRIINIINNLSLLLSGIQKKLYSSANWDLVFDHAGKKLEYCLFIENFIVQKEQLIVDGILLLERNEEGIGKIKAVEEDKKISFQIDPDEIAAVKKRDGIQHPFLEDLFMWSKSLRTYRFGSTLGQTSYALPQNLQSATELEVLTSHEQEWSVAKDFERVVTLFQQGVMQCPSFLENVKEDMSFIGYDLESIDYAPINHSRLVLNNTSNPAGTIFGLFIREKGVDISIPQSEISQGMFRALSLIIQLNYIQLSTPTCTTCILIDDIGEGLDFDRSTKLIKLLINKVIDKNIYNFQMLLTSNDRFVMNVVPLEYWIVIARNKSNIKFYNHRNTKALFDKFAFTGLSNFDFFSSNFIEHA